MIEELVLKKFIYIGRELENELSPSKVLLNEVKNYADINTIGPTECKVIAAKISVSDLSLLIKSIVIAESLFKWIGGSVASSIWLFRELQSKDYYLSISLANWILPRTTNYYVPFGFNNHGAKTYDEYLVIAKRMSDQRQKCLIELEEIEKKAAIEREMRTAQKTLSASLRKSEERKQLIKKLDNLSIYEQIDMIAHDNNYSVEFYPTSLAGKCSKEIISTFSQELQKKLLEKLKGKHKGPWHNFKSRLIENFYKKDYQIRMPWDRKPWHSY